MWRKSRTWLFRAALLGTTLAALLLALRLHQISGDIDLAPWHRWVPEELQAARMDQLDWQGWLQAEQQLFDEVEAQMAREMEPGENFTANRYVAGSSVHPSRFATNWNRSYRLIPQGLPRGSAVLLHGLTDSPYSLHHIAQLYVRNGFIAVGIRVPGHGTVPASLTRAGWEDWLAAARLAMREARAASSGPLHLVGYSMGGAVSMLHALRALDDVDLPRADRIVLFSPMIGVAGASRYAGLAGWPAILPAFAKTAWLDLLPEYNPYKYNSFPVHAARESYLLTSELARAIRAAEKHGKLERLPPILAFQSIVDATVVSQSLFTELFSRLPSNGSELVVFDVNRNAGLEPLLTGASLSLAASMLPAGAQRYRLDVVGNAPGSDQVTLSSRAAGQSTVTVHRLELNYPREFFSLSHVALPFPPSDALYGAQPIDDSTGIHLGMMPLRGERGILLGDVASLARTSWNPFFPLVVARIEFLLHP